ncbi:nose resistant to fluoxetine protein 6-like isoform X2 [Rhodnius prolixus]
MLAHAWILQILARTMASYVPFAMEGGLCTTHGQLYSTHLSNLTHWAVQMLDSSSAGLSGLLSGNRYDFGSQDQCAELAVPELHIYGRYLVFSLKFSLNSTQFKEQSMKVYKKPHPNNSVWQEFIRTNDPRVNPTNEIYWAVCVPASCSSVDVEHSLKSTLMPVLQSNGIAGNLKVLDKYTYCKMDPPLEAPLGYHLFLVITVGLITGVVLITIYHLSQENSISAYRKKWYYKFSMVTNLNNLLPTEKTKEFRAISGLKVITMFLVILGHRMLISMFTPMINQRENELIIGNLGHTYIKNGALIVNTFFEVTGFLTFYKILTDVEKNRPVSVWKSIFRRWIRLVPAYAFMMGFVVYLAPQLDSGPVGRGILWHSSCQNYWWTNVLFINNYYHPNKSCLIPSWYMACDLQFYAICSILGYVMYRSKKTGLLLLIVLTIVSIVMPGIVVYWKHYDGTTLFYQKTFDYYLNNQEFAETYFQAHLRASPFLIGMVAAYIYHLLKRNNTKIPKLLIWLLVPLLAVMMNSSILGAWIFYIPGRDYRLWENVLYASLHRIGWAVPVAFVIVADAYIAFAICRKTVGLKVFQYLNGLTYSALLVHTPLQFYLAGMARTPLYYNSFILLWMSMGDIFLTYLLALVLYLFVEAPMTVMQDLLDTTSDLMRGCHNVKDKRLQD